jgi:cyclophilin family peptidyl-prolyl cis-trans isomerase
MKRPISKILVISALLIGAGCQPVKPEVKDTAISDAMNSLATSKQTDGFVSKEIPEAKPQPVENIKDSTNTISEITSMPEKQVYSFPGVLPESETDARVRIKTSKGDIVVQLLPKEGPNDASNFVYLIKQKFYDGLIFHRYEPGFVIQGGDPLGNGTGGPGYRFADDKVSLSYERGIVAMANAGANTNGSQFFIMLDNVPLPPSYSIFGRVVEGLNVVDQIRVGDVMTTVSIEQK